MCRIFVTHKSTATCHGRPKQINNRKLFAARVIHMLVKQWSKEDAHHLPIVMPSRIVQPSRLRPGPGPPAPCPQPQRKRLRRPCTPARTPQPHPTPAAAPAPPERARSRAAGCSGRRLLAQGSAGTGRPCCGPRAGGGCSCDGAAGVLPPRPPPGPLARDSDILPQASSAAALPPTVSTTNDSSHSSRNLVWAICRCRLG